MTTLLLPNHKKAAQRHLVAVHFQTPQLQTKMKAKKTIKPTAVDETTKLTVEAVKNITDLSKLELERKKKVDPGIE